MYSYVESGVDDIFEGVERGVDMFDCISPTRLARMGIVFLRPESGGRPENKWRMHLNASIKEDSGPIDPNCTCTTCTRFSRAYLRHLLKTGELLGFNLTTIHNLHYTLQLFREIRAAMKDGTYSNLKAKWFGR
ncbi:tRNA-guanine transglycosylase [Patescibacteria group bacterium]